MLLLLSLLGCSDPGPKDTGDPGGDTATDTADTSADSGDTGGDTGETDTGETDTGGDTGETDTGGDTGLPDGLHGQAPDKNIPAPTFKVFNQDREKRTRDDLMGHPTVVWFYPAAATGG